MTTQSTEYLHVASVVRTQVKKRPIKINRTLTPKTHYIPPPILCRIVPIPTTETT